MGPTVHEREIEVAALHPGTVNQILSMPSTLVKHVIVYLYLYLPSTLLPMINRSFSFEAPQLGNSLPRDRGVGGRSFHKLLGIFWATFHFSGNFFRYEQLSYL